MKKLLLASALVLAACSGSGGDTDTMETVEVSEQPIADTQPMTTEVGAMTIADAIAHPRRADDAARDQFRNPGPTLDFLGISPGQTVAEIWPGWYTPILAPYLADNDGTYVAVMFPEGLSEGMDGRINGFKDKYADAETYGTIEYGSFFGGTVNDEPVPTVLSLPDNSVDTILTFRNVHNWMGRGYADEAFEEFFRALKPGGTLGVVEHRLPETQTQDPRGSTGYVQESYMKALAADAGFEFVESSEVNANPLDTADHPFGVWTLPPRSRTPEAGTPEASAFDAELYLNIGESDRATLKFRKPE